LNEVKVSFLQRKFIDRRYGYDSDVAGELGLGGVSKAAFPWFVVPGYAVLGGNVSRIQTPIRDTQFQDAISYFRGPACVQGWFGVPARVEQRIARPFVFGSIWHNAVDHQPAWYCRDR
jgi:hypothetical protein